MSYHPQVEPNPSWAQATWFVDPQNVSGTASDNNTGIDATHAVLSYNGGIVAKWETNAPTLRQSTTITWLSSQPDDSDPVVCRPTLVNAQLVIQGQLPVATHTGALAGVVAKVRANPGNDLQATLGYAAVPGDFLLNTTGGKASAAFVYTYAAPTGTLTQPETSPVLPLQDGAPAPTEVNTWANADTYAAYRLFTVNIVNVSVAVGELVTNPATLVPAVIMRLNMGGVTAGLATIGSGCSVVECSTSVGTVLIDDTVNNEIITYFWNLFIQFDAQSSHPGGANVPGFFGGALISAGGASDVSWSFVNDAIVDASASAISIGTPAYNLANAEPNIGAVHIRGTLAVRGPLNLNGATLWGSGTLDAIGGARIFYSAGRGAAATFGSLSGIQANGVASSNPFDPVTAVWHGAIALTAANLDAAFGVAGFGGNAVNPGGATYTNKGTP